METYQSHIYSDPVLPISFRKKVIDESGILSHWHEELELLFVVKGNITAVLDSVSVNAGVSDLVVINSNCLHHVYSPSGQSIYYFMIIDKKLSDEFGIHFNEFFFQQLINDTKIKEIFTNMIHEFERQDSLYKLYIKSNIMELFIHLYRNYMRHNYLSIDNQQNIAEYKKEYIQIALQYIQDNFKRSLTVDEIAKKVGLSKFYFSRLFKEMTSLTVVDFINKSRCFAVKNLLQTGKYAVGEAALSCGFDNFSYFSKTYKKHIGCLPSKQIPQK